MDDLFQLARLGIVKAARRFDPSHGTTFRTYATWYARGEIAHAVRKRGLIRVDVRRGRQKPMIVSLERLGMLPLSLPDAARLMVPDRSLELAEQRTDLRRILGRLPHQEQLVVFYTYIYPVAQTKIATMLHISQRHVSRLLTRFHHRPQQ